MLIDDEYEIDIDREITLIFIHHKATASCLEKDLFGFIISLEVKSIMETKDIILELRNKAGLSQDELAEKIFVTRQTVSRWENGD